MRLLLKAQVIDHVMFRYCIVDSPVDTPWARYGRWDKVDVCGNAFVVLTCSVTCLLQWWTSQLQTELQKRVCKIIYTLWEKKAKKRCMRIRSLQKNKGEGLLYFLFSVWDGRTWSIDVNNLRLISLNSPLKMIWYWIHCVNFLTALVGFCFIPKFRFFWLTFPTCTLHWRLLLRFD